MRSVVDGIKWASSDGFDVKTPLCHLTSWVAWDELPHQPGRLSLSVHICKMELVGATLLGFGVVNVESVSIAVSAIEETPNQNSSYLSYQCEMEYRSH